MGIDNLWSQNHFKINHTSLILNVGIIIVHCYYRIMEKMYKINTSAAFYIRKNLSFTSFIAKRDATGKQIFR
jgi:hypothetical protein